MKLHIITVGQPKLAFAKSGWQEYIKRLGRYHQVRTTHLADKSADDAAKFLDAVGSAFKVGLVIKANQLTSTQLATFLDERAREGQYRKDNEVCFMIGGPEGLPTEVIEAADMQWSLSELTFPHDLAMVVCAETLYRASTISAGHPYHRE